MINIQNTDDKECCKWCFVRHVHPADHNSRITDEDFSKRLDFKEIKFPVKTRDIYKFEEENKIRIPSALAFWLWK